MAILNLFKVTKTLLDLLAQNITKNIDTSLAGLLDIRAVPPESVENPSNTLSVFLYHIAEDPHFKNALGPGNDPPNVAKTPMALSLFYILTAHHETNAAFDAEVQQKLMGYALKTLHDFPVITNRTRINGSTILDPEFGTDTIQIILRPVTPEDSLSFWSSEDIRTTRLSAYYEVRVVMLEPEAPRIMPGIVLNLGAFLFQLGSPHLERSQSVVRFRIPLRNGGSIQEVEATPARVTLDSSANPPGAHNRLLILGSNLTTGKPRSIVLKNTIWSRLQVPPRPVEQAIVDLSVNPGWTVDFQTDRIRVDLAPVLRHIQPDGTQVDLPVLPGSYTALERSVVDEKVINNDLKQILVSSNEVSFSVSPRIAGHDVPDGAGNIQVNLGAEFDPLDPNLSPDAIQVIVDGEVYERVVVDPPANPKEFLIANVPSNLIRIRPHFPVLAGQSEAHAFRVVVNGAESAPFWIELS
ncbi:MAG: DUF4255 domain-containing protein [Bryobacteraceae bacterium]